jgi:hypothetical protein
MQNKNITSHSSGQLTRAHFAIATCPQLPAAELKRYVWKTRENKMAEVRIPETSIDDKERLRVYPGSKEYDRIYRAACEVHWDKAEKFLYSPKPREWSYVNWFAHILYAVKSEYGDQLIVDDKTEWKNISEEMKKQIISLEEKEDIES